jgi:hypothetical protein
MAFKVSEANGAGAAAADELSTLSAPLHKESGSPQALDIKPKATRIVLPVFFR